MAVPFVDLGAQYRTIQAEIDEAIRAVIAGNAFVLGPAVERFETDFAQYLGVDHVVGTSNGTTALQLSLLALGVGPGDEVILPAHTFIATAEAVSHVGARPVLVDVREDSGNLDPDLLADAVTSRTKAIIPVHLYGQPADLEPILEFGRQRGIPIVEDACQAHGAAYGGSRVGQLRRHFLLFVLSGEESRRLRGGGRDCDRGSGTRGPRPAASRPRTVGALSPRRGGLQRAHGGNPGSSAGREAEASRRLEPGAGLARGCVCGRSCRMRGGNRSHERAQAEPTSSISTWSVRRIATSFEIISRAGEYKRGSTIRSRFTSSRRTRRSAFAQGASRWPSPGPLTGLSLPMFPELTLPRWRRWSRGSGRSPYLLRHKRITVDTLPSTPDSLPPGWAPRDPSPGPIPCDSGRMPLGGRI